MLTRTSEAASSSDAAGSPSPPDAPVPTSRIAGLTKIVRILLWTVILTATGYFVVMVIPLLSPPRQPPQAPNPAPTAVEGSSGSPQLADLLEGYWTTDDSRFGLAGQRVDADQLDRHWAATGPEPLPDSSSLDQELAALLATHAAATQSADHTLYERSLPNLRMRGVVSRHDPPRLRLFQIAIRDGAGWALGEIVPSPEARENRKPQSLVADIEGTRLLRRWSSDEQLSGEIVIASSSDVPLVPDLRGKGWTVDRAESLGALTAWRIRRGPAQRLVMSFADAAVPGLDTVVPAAEGSALPSSTPRPAAETPSTSVPSPPPARLFIILKTASDQEHP